MCGIAGWYRRGGRPVTAAVVRAQCDAIIHRGPDDDGVLSDGDLGMGMRRLSILDIAGGHQPMTTPDGRFSIVYNGEVYNHRDVRERLAGHGWRFAGHSDTETVLAAFAQWGDAAWPLLEGMFGVAIWDRRDRRLTLARDPLGIKPLYVTEQAGGIAFASELKSLRVLPGLAFTVDDRALHDVFSFGHVRAPRSIFREVRMLPPGTSLSIGPDGEAVQTTYWRPEFRSGPAQSDAAWTEQMREMLLATTARHLQADVPVAAFLSGGIDSAAVLAAMVRAGGAPIKAFTVGYPGSPIDETAAAAATARHLGCEHVVLPLAMDDVARELPAILAGFDEPFADMAAVPTWYASKLAAEHVKVVLCGEGGDELFAGYKRHRNARLVERARPFAGLLGGLAARWPVTGSAGLNTLRQHARRGAEMLALPDGYPQFFAATRTSAAGLLGRAFTADFAQRMAGCDDPARLEAEFFPAGGPRADTALDKFLLADLTLNMPSAMLTRLDRASMAHSLEARVPLLSHRLVDWALTMPAAMKLRGTTGKYILRQAVAPWLPPATMTRPKQGFQIPHTAWLRGELGELALETWRSSGAADAGFLDTEVVEQLFAEHRRGDADHARFLYTTAAVALWWQNSRPAVAAAA